MNIENFYDSLLAKEGFADYTVEGYRKVVSHFLRGNKPTIEAVENYIAEMRKKKYSFSHIRNCTVILERLMAFLGSPIRLGRMRRPKPIVKEVLTEGEVARILGDCKNNREKAIISILAYSGIRNKEFCNLRVQDVDLDKNVIRIFDGKFNKDRLAYISQDCARLITDYLNQYPRDKNEFLITALVSGRQYNGWALRKRVKVVAERAGIRKRVYPHLFRHSITSHLASKNCSMVTIMNLLGHANLTTTQLYLRSFPQKIQAEYQYLVPSYL